MSPIKIEDCEKNSGEINKRAVSSEILVRCLFDPHVDDAFPICRCLQTPKGNSNVRGVNVGESFSPVDIRTRVLLASFLSQFISLLLCVSSFLMGHWLLVLECWVAEVR